MAGQENTPSRVLRFVGDAQAVELVASSLTASSVPLATHSQHDVAALDVQAHVRASTMCCRCRKG